MKTLYEILEVSETASKEVIEKAYKVLAKKHHPDLQTPENKNIAEKKMKEINEAYSILGDEEKRKEYDEKLLHQREMQKQQEANQQANINTVPIYKQEERTKQRVDDMQRRRYEAELLKQQTKMQKQMQEEYQNAYYNYLRSLGYRIKEKWTWKKTRTLIIIIAILSIIGAILWYIPATHEMMLDLYNSNIVIKTLIDIVISIVTALFRTIGSIFK